ncbi:NADPH-dependent FMN reductase [Protofrankia sp. BMG5.30]|uniref:NADPH-dependent FMN reductase n=1 Tax=Protofrankia sp. BMG5.30 TaxID=1834514 RepID=UPI0009761C87|nr:NAD(P)H-dependent oxidoreductase [Protofrankia sp. BMG5.30]ONH34080.1 FMN reductase [Protofrankia sp. BMG5.30]
MPQPFPRIIVLSGNPRPGSRTLTVARALADRIRDGLTADPAFGTATPEPAAESGDVDLALLAPELFTDSTGAVASAVESVRGAGVLVVATPVYKATYTGLLKAFLDPLPSGALAGVVAIPVIVSGAPAHLPVTELHLRPLLAELGATVPVPAFSIIEARLPELDDETAAWSAANGGLVRAAVTALAAAAPVTVGAATGSGGAR